MPLPTDKNACKNLRRTAPDATVLTANGPRWVLDTAAVPPRSGFDRRRSTYERA